MWKIGPAVTVAGWLATMGPATAQPVSDERTRLKFDRPVEVPGRTLPAGQYTFKLAESRSNRDIVQIFDEQGKLLVTTVAIPRRRMEPVNDLTITFAHTPDPAVPVAMVAWFYPGEVNGHEFVYPEKQAGEIESRTQTLVLSSDVETGRLAGWEQARLKGFESGDKRQDYRTRNDLPKTARAVPTSEPSAVGTSGGADAGAAATVTAGDLADHPDRYYGKTISVTAEVEDVYNNSVFSLDEDKVWSTGQDVIVINPRPATAVRNDTRLIVTGKVRQLSLAEFEREFQGVDWNLRPAILSWIDRRPVIVAESIRTQSGDELVTRP
jgi:hypothetical protein